jgi:molecular chaperone GrpE
MEKPGFSRDIETGAETIHTPGGQTERPRGRGESANGADLADTDMSAEHPSRADGPHQTFDTPNPRRVDDEVADLRDRHLRLAAEFDNYRKRVARERTELVDRAQATFVVRLLDVLDDLDRVVASDPNSTPLPALRDALTAVDKKLWKELQNAGVERVDPTGEPFDASTQEAVSVVPPPDPSKDHTVAATFQYGYRMKGTLIRPARVQVYSSQGHA